METRYNFEFFLDECKTTKEPELYTFLVEKGEAVFVGKELHIDERKIVYYLLPFEDNTSLVILKMSDDEPYDSLIKNIDEYNVDGAKNAWPLLMAALSNGLNDNYLSPSLIKLNDLFWGLSLMAENVSLDNLDSEYIVKKVVSLYSYAIDMLNQMIENDISTWDKLKGHGKAAADGWKWGRIASTVLTIGGALFGLPELGDVIDS